MLMRGAYRVEREGLTHNALGDSGASPAAINNERYELNESRLRAPL